MNKHTPGPWKNQRWNDDELIMEVNDSTGWREKYPEAYIAKLGGWGYSKHGEANARLIATAPDLLAECKRILDIIDLGKGNETWAKNIVSGLKAVIAKAEGDNHE